MYSQLYQQQQQLPYHSRDVAARCPRKGHHSITRCKSATKALAAASYQPAAVVTGCSTGIGRETALLLAQKGWCVFAGARKDEDLRRLGELHDNITPTHIDVTQPACIEAAKQQVTAARGSNGLQLLMNNAGVGMVAPVEFFPLEEFRQVMEVNLFGVVATSQAFIPLLRQGPQKGRILNISSVAGHLPLPFWSAYCSSKHALEGFSDCLRYELAPQGVPVVLIKPGPVDTPIWHKSREKSYAAGSSAWEAATQVYGSQLQAMSEQVEYSKAGAIPVSQVVNLIYEAATAPNPKSRYHIGENAALYHWAKRLLPDAVWEGIISSRLAASFSTIHASSAEATAGVQQEADEVLKKS